VRPFDSPNNTVWVFEKDTPEEDIFLVLAEYSDRVLNEHPGKSFRKHLSLTFGDVGWFAEESHVNYKSKEIK